VSDAPERPLDLQELFRVLAEQGVDYLVIGGVAAQVHGRRRTTKDLDLTPAPDPENFERLAAALVTLEARPVEVDFGASAPIPTAEQLRLAPIVPPLSTRHGELHILNQVPGASVYAEMRARALSIDLDGIPMQIIGLDDLIRMKQTLGRPGDIEDVQVLTAVARLEARGSDPSKHGIETNASELPGSDK
jgi:predicted nucleotidyltransferase